MVEPNRFVRKVRDLRSGAVPVLSPATPHASTTRATSGVTGRAGRSTAIPAEPLNPAWILASLRAGLARPACLREPESGRLWHESGTRSGATVPRKDDQIRLLADDLEGVGVPAYTRPGAQAHLGSNPAAIGHFFRSQGSTGGQHAVARPAPTSVLRCLAARGESTRGSSIPWRHVGRVRRCHAQELPTTRGTA